jgi:DNA invertase Pin-like site-specific DNA recombinase
MSEKAVAYLRVSGIGQAAEDRDGLPRQRGKVAAAAAAAGLEVVEWFTDAGVSGTRELDDRPALSELVRRVTGNGIKVVIVENLSRLARDLGIQEFVLRDLWAAGCRVISCDEGEIGDDTDPTRTLIRQILGGLAEYEKKMIVAKLAGARARKRREHGKCEGRPFFGDRPGEKEIIERMRALRVKPRGMPRPSFAQVAAALDAEGHRTRSGKPWSASVVRRILARER